MLAITACMLLFIHLFAKLKNMKVFALFIAILSKHVFAFGANYVLTNFT